MSLKNQLQKIEGRLDKVSAVVPGDGPKIVINLSWDPAEGSIIADGEQMTRAEFERRYPGYDPGAGDEITLSWGDED